MLIVNEVVTPIVKGFTMLLIFKLNDKLVEERVGKEVAANTALVAVRDTQAGTQRVEPVIELE